MPLFNKVIVSGELNVTADRFGFELAPLLPDFRVVPWLFSGVASPFQSNTTSPLRVVASTTFQGPLIFYTMMSPEVVTSLTLVLSDMLPSVSMISPETELILSSSMRESRTRKSPEVDLISIAISPPSI